MSCTKNGLIFQHHTHGDWVWVLSIKSWLFPLYLFWTAALSVTNLVHVHQQECLVKRFICCTEGQSHSEGSELHFMHVCTLKKKSEAKLLNKEAWKCVFFESRFIKYGILCNDKGKSETGDWAYFFHVFAGIFCKMPDTDWWHNIMNY